MNRDALEHLFEQMDCTWTELGSQYDDAGYLLRTATLDPDELAEISACGASVESYPSRWFRVFDDGEVVIHDGS